jgi:hypothetical protein
VLSEGDARAIIVKEMDYPEIINDVLWLGNDDDKVDLMIASLIEEGYIKPDPVPDKSTKRLRFVNTYIYLPTQTGSTYIDKIRKYYRPGG